MGPQQQHTPEAAQSRARLRFLLDFLGRVLTVETEGPGGEVTVRIPEALARCSHAAQGSPNDDVLRSACNAAFTYLDTENALLEDPSCSRVSVRLIRMSLSFLQRWASAYLLLPSDAPRCPAHNLFAPEREGSKVLELVMRKVAVHLCTPTTHSHWDTELGDADLKLCSRLVWEDSVGLLESLMASTPCATILARTRGWATLLAAYQASAPADGAEGAGGALTEAMRSMGINGGKPNAGGSDGPKGISMQHLPSEIKNALLQTIYTPTRADFLQS
jgi:hypothetical protein